MTPRFDVACVGTLNVDLILLGDAPRDPEELVQWVAPARVELTPAGSVGYTAADLARLGLRVSLLSSVADDLFGRWILSRLQAEGVNTEAVTVESGQTSGIGVYLLLFGSRKRPLTGRLATHAPWPPQLTSLGEEHLGNSRLLHCGGYLHYPELYGEPTEKLFAEAKRRGLITSLDAQFPFQPPAGKWLPLFGGLLQHVDLLFTDETEARAMTGEKDPEAAARLLLAEGPRLVAVKMGDQGALLADRERVIHQPAFPVSEVVDSIGAGDAFDAGLIYSALHGWDLGRSAAFAAAVAALTLRGMGGTAAAPKLREVEAFLDRPGAPPPPGAGV